MESVTILNAIGLINDEMIESAVIQVPLKKNMFDRMTALRRAVAIAAGFALIIGLLFAISQLRSYGSLGGPDDPVIGVIGTQGSESTLGTEPTQGTEPIPGTEPTQGNDTGHLTVGSAMMDVMSPYAMSCTISVEYETVDGYIPITVSFGLSQYCEFDSAHFDYFPDILLQAGNYDDETIITLRRMNTEEITQPEYKVEYVWDEDRWVIGFIFTHTETVQLPLALFSGSSGRIWIGISEHSNDGSLGSGAHVVLDYTRTEDNITFAVVQSCLTG